MRLEELIDTREAIQVKYNLVPDTENTEGFDTIRRKLEAEVARAQARGQDDASVTVYENAMVAAAQGMAAINAQIDENYDKEYALIQLIEDSAEREAALSDLNQRYTAERRQAALEYAQLMQDIVLPVWSHEEIQPGQQRYRHAGRQAGTVQHGHRERKARAAGRTEPDQRRDG